MSWCCGNCSKLRVKPHVISSGQPEPRGSARPSSACWRAQPMTLGSRRRRSRANSIFALKRLPLPSTSSSAAASSAAVPRAVVDHLTSQSPIRDELPSTPHGHRSSPSMSPLTCSSQRMQRALLPHSSPNCVRTWPRPDQRQRLADDVVEAAAAIVDHRHIAATQRRHRAINSTEQGVADVEEEEAGRGCSPAVGQGHDPCPLRRTREGGEEQQPKPVRELRPVTATCPRCFVALPTTGQCDACT